MYPVSPVVPPHFQNNVQRSWSDEHIPVNSCYPIRPAPRSSSFSASRAPQPQWNTYPPPPPVPPLPPSLPPSFYSPPSSHANIDIAFADPPRFPLLPQGWRLGPSYNFISPPSSWHPTDHHNHSTSALNIAPPRPALPPRPTTSYDHDYITDTPNLGGSHTSSCAIAQSFISLDHPLAPPPAVPLAIPPRPVTALGEVRSERSPTKCFQAAPSPPALPPKTILSPVSPLLPSPSHEIPTSSGQVTIVSLPSSDAQCAPNTSVTKSALSGSSEPQVLETMSLDHKRAMTLSIQESHRKQSAVEPIENEEEEFARALAESLSFSAGLEQNAVPARNYLQTDALRLITVTHSPVEQDNPQQCAQDSTGVSETPSRRRPSFQHLGGIDILSPEELEDHAAHGQIMQELEDEEVTRQLQEEEEKRLAAELREREREDEKRARMDAEFTKRLQEEEALRLEAEKRERELRDEERALLDAEIARREAVEEQAREMIREAQERKDAEMARRMAETSDAGRTNLPKEMMREAWERKDAEKARRMTVTNGPGQAYAPRGVPSAYDPALVSRAPGLPPYNNIVAVSGRSTPPTAQIAQPTPQIDNGCLPPRRPGRAASAFACGPVRPAESDPARSGFLATRRPSDSMLGPESMSLPSRDPSPRRNSSPRPSVSPSRMGPDPGPDVTMGVNAMGTDLLNGVSYGFKPPDTHSAGALLPCPPFPEVISLSRGLSPPFHIMATSWKHLMRLLAQLETRIQANLDAIAQSKAEYLLRVVVQVAKISRSANTWCTILHITLDQPIPRDARYLYRGTTTLPYSYTLGELTPYLVNDTYSQFYVIPLSAASPFPILPISLPNLALYLQSAMRDSRAGKVQNDPYGMRRLAKMVTECYPEEVVNSDQEGRKSSRGVGNLFKRVVGRGGGREASQVNEDVYDIITPFRIDQYTVS